ncbi:CPSF3 [Lepeophtheirus salmonis]|uniref:CPSF3 n=1 Tax=Lepeophtheirus salmonis TaxID=72036 RepID=A0A7R8D2W8_LEPSM|nr:CPSF3 [Lepeophtheirus salmonis]CAF2959920.1 CPSF3 [Lepeophtheirus salmonis]
MARIQIGWFFRPLGAGQEVGRSCHLLEFKDKRILLDCGIHPGLSGMDALPFVDLIEADEIDLLLVSHFHLDHAGALPWFLEKTTFKGKRAAMFMIEIAGVRTLYTGDFSREEDRHLMAAEVPSLKPHVLILESTYGTNIHEKREDRESRFTSTVHDIVTRGGRCLIPVFALGRAQELLLILDEYWGAHPELHEIPIYYASSLAKKCMAVAMRYFLASPGMMQSGLSRELFESWCSDPKNGCIVAGYCVEGTLAKHILSEPEEVASMNGQKLPLKMQVNYISFSAHTDYKQTSGFIRELKPPHVILVHGEANEMSRLKSALIREYEADPSTKIDFYNPRNTVSVDLFFRGEKMAKVMGSLAVDPPIQEHRVSGILVKRNFNYHILSPSDLPKYTDMTTSVVTQRQRKRKKKKYIRVFDSIDVIHEDKMITLEWIASPAESLDTPQYIPANARVDKMHFKECCIELLQDMFGEESVPKTFSGDKFGVIVHNKKGFNRFKNLGSFLQ